MFVAVADTHTVIWYIFDDVIAATALYLGVPLISRDRKIRLTDIETIW